MWSEIWGEKRGLIFITALFLVWTVGQVDPYAIVWVTQPVPVRRKFELAAYQFQCDSLVYWAIFNTL